MQAFGKRSVDLLEDAGWLSPRTWVAHAIHANEDEIGRLGQAGVAVSHLAASDMAFGVGICPTRNGRRPARRSASGSTARRRTTLRTSWRRRAMRSCCSACATATPRSARMTRCAGERRRRTLPRPRRHRPHRRRPPGRPRPLPPRRTAFLRRARPDRRARALRRDPRRPRHGRRPLAGDRRAARGRRPRGADRPAQGGGASVRVSKRRPARTDCVTRKIEDFLRERRTRLIARPSSCGRRRSGGEDLPACDLFGRNRRLGHASCRSAPSRAVKAC